MELDIQTTQNAEAAEEIIKTVSEEELKIIKEMINAGLMYGHKKSKTDPAFKQFIFATRNGIEMIDLTKTLNLIEAAAKFLSEQIKENKTVLLVATQPAGWEAIIDFAKKFNLPYIKNRWIGGLITNFKIIFQRLEYFRKIEADMAAGEFDKYPKKEKVIISRSIHRMKEMFEGLENLTKPIDALFVVDPSLKGHKTAIQEAKIKNLPVVAVVDSDDNPTEIDYPIPANDHAKMSIEWIISKIAEKI